MQEFIDEAIVLLCNSLDRVLRVDTLNTPFNLNRVY